MAKKPRQRARQRAQPPAGTRGFSRQGLAIAAVLALLLGAGLWMKYGGGGKEPPIPAPRTADGKVAVIEFSDYG